ncbi:MAG: Cu(I)-responsive transcriptional regulator [Proteobacteria bacterium]|nr:Cu(I)-responsive transcriptional regulator [Pseudomonadota bacterium]
MNIGMIAKKADLPVKTVRYYADVGLVKPTGRTDAGYRTYDGKTLRKLIFVRRSRAMGFSIEECRKLLGLFEDQSRASAEVRKIAKQHLVEIDTKLDELKKLQKELSLLVGSCNGDDRPDCPILDALGRG